MLQLPPRRTTAGGALYPHCRSHNLLLLTLLLASPLTSPPLLLVVRFCDVKFEDG